MAQKLSLPRPYHGMGHIWNISQNVGPTRESPNLPADVQLVKYLASLTNNWMPMYRSECLSPKLNLDDKFDAVLAFWIGVWGRAYFADVGVDIQTMVPAKGTEPSSILLLNDLAHQISPSAWGEAPTHFRLLPEVRSMLTGTTVVSGGTTTMLRKR